MSSDYNIVLNKIQGFIKKYYTNEVIKGFLIFLAVALFYLLSIILLENFLWLSTTFRTIMFWTFIIVSVYLFIRFIGISLAKLIKIGKQITPIEASKIIGNHFPEVDDQLVNLLQLKSSNINSDLLEASITQKSKELSPIPFSSAINFKKSLSYAKYALIPLFLYLFFSVFKGFSWYKDSLNRVVNYDVSYTAPAPFYFTILNKDLNALENSDFTLDVSVVGKTVPNQVQIDIKGTSYFLKKTDFDKYSYTFNNLKETVSFRLVSGKVKSKDYKILVNDVPTILDFNLSIDPPNHTNVKTKVLKNSGNTIVPEGSKLSWNINSKNASKVNFITTDSIYDFNKNDLNFIYSKTLRDDLDYQISSSNKFVTNYEKLDFSIEVIKDQSPLINVLVKQDTLDIERKFYYGRVSDDYGVSKVRIVYFKSNEPNFKSYKLLKSFTSSIGEFTYQFPNNLNLEEANNYAFYFEVLDNDSFNGAKSSRSKTFNFSVSTKIEKDIIESQSQQRQLDDFQNTIEKFENSKLDLESFSKLQKQSLSVSFKNKEKLSTVLEKQLKEQKKLEKLSDNLKKVLDKSNDQNTKLTKDELQRTKKQLEKNKKLIEEIKKAVEKLTPKELKSKLDELKKENKKVTKNLSQILELTKRYYVIDKHQRIVQMLELLSEKQIKASTNEMNLEEQKILNKEYKFIREELDDLRLQNAKLRKPMVLDDDSVFKGKIQTKQEEATDNIKKSNNDSAKKKQNVAGVMMKNLANKMSSTAAASGGDELKDDEETLRQILDNLVLFSINQENNMERFSNINTNNPNYSKYIRTQNKLREHFQHIDDSLYALSSKNPKIGTKINDLISDIDYNLESSLESITDNRTYQGVTKLRFAISNSNDLAVMLSKSLKQINQRQKPGEGKPKDQGFQLPDIIKKQESLNKAFQEALQAGQKKPGDSKKQGDGGEKKAGDSGKEGKSGENGKSGEEGSQGKDGKGGESGQNGQDGNSGKNGKSGENGKSGQGGKSGNDGSFGIGKGESGQGQGQGDGEGESSENGEGKSKGKNSKSGKGKDGNSNSNDGDSKSDKGKSDGKGKSRGKGEGEDNGKGKGKGSSKDAKSGGQGEGDGDEENDYEQLFEIYKQQQDLRNQLENRIIKEGIKTSTEKRVLSQMKQVENELIEKGFNTETLNRMLNLKHQLFKLDKAQFQQGKDKKRKSKVNTKSYVSDKLITPDQIKKYFNTTEILNRETLPLNSNFKKRVNIYFTE